MTRSPEEWGSIQRVHQRLFSCSYAEDSTGARLKNGLQSRGPSPTVRPSDYQMIGQRPKTYLINLAFADCFGLSSSLRAFGLSRARERSSLSPNPRSVSQTKAPLDKLSSRASRRPVVTVLSYRRKSSPQPPRAGTPPSPLFPHHRAIFHYVANGGLVPPPLQCSVFLHSDT